MSRFDVCLAFVLAREGGYADDPLDRGGATNRGVTQRLYDIWRRSRGRPERDVREIEDDEVYAVYLEEFWVPTKCDTVPAGLDLCMFDAAVQHGVTRAVQLLQRTKSIGVIDTGYFGHATATMLRRVVEAGTVGNLISEYQAARRDFYRAIVSYDPTQKRFERGWANRMAALEGHLMGNMA